MVIELGVPAEGEGREVTQWAASKGATGAGQSHCEAALLFLKRSPITRGRSILTKSLKDDLGNYTVVQLPFFPKTLRRVLLEHVWEHEEGD